MRTQSYWTCEARCWLVPLVSFWSTHRNSRSGHTLLDRLTVGVDVAVVLPVVDIRRRLLVESSAHLLAASSNGRDHAAAMTSAPECQPYVAHGTTRHPNSAIARSRVGLRNTPDGMVHREAPPNGLSEQRSGCASNGSSALLRAAHEPGEPRRVPHSPCQRQSSISRQRALKVWARAQGRTIAMRGGVRRVRSPPWWRRAPVRARAAGVARDRRAGPTVPRACRR